MTDAVVE